MDKKVILKEIVTRELEKRHKEERESLYKFIKTRWKEEKKEYLEENWHIKAICEKLEAVFYGDIKRLMINIPPRSLKTEIVSKAFPIWAMGNKPQTKFLSLSYASGLAQKTSDGARSMYESMSYMKTFPRKSPLSDSQNTKQYWENQEGGQYYAAGSRGTITGIGADIIIIDDPLKPEEAESDLVRTQVNNNYHDTIKSRLNDRREGAIIIIMQRLHDDDLCGHLINAEEIGTGEPREKLIIPAIGTGEFKEYGKGESFFEARFPIDMLHEMQKANPVNFSCQYLQDPVAKESQEFHEEWFRYYNHPVAGGRTFTTCDPAFKKGQHNDFSAIITGKFIEDKLYILEVTQGKYNPGELIDKLIYHYVKRQPEKIGIEAFQAQAIIGFNLKSELAKKGYYANIEELTEIGDKEGKIRKLVPFYRNGLIYHTTDLAGLENELIKFPRGRNDDMIDALQMLYYLYRLQPNTPKLYEDPEIKYDENGRPFF